MGKFREKLRHIIEPVGFKRVKEITVRCALLDKEIHKIEKNPKAYSKEEINKVLDEYENLVNEIQRDNTLGRVAHNQFEKVKNQINDKRKTLLGSN